MTKAYGGPYIILADSYLDLKIWGYTFMLERL